MDLRRVILLDSQSTLDLVCNEELVTGVVVADHNMRLASNGGTMTVRHKAKIAGYDQQVWFDKKAITNIISLKNLIKQ